MEWIWEYWIEAIFGLLILGLSAGYKKLYRKIEEQDAVRDGVQALLRDRILQVYGHYTEKKYYPIYARENVEAIFIQYKALGGNGTVHELVERLREMPTEKEREE